MTIEDDDIITHHIQDLVAIQSHEASCEIRPTVDLLTVSVPTITCTGTNIISYLRIGWACTLHHHGQEGVIIAMAVAYWVCA
jgi:hypothetical protein